jgi:hypothetical protein
MEDKLRHKITLLPLVLLIVFGTIGELNAEEGFPDLRGPYLGQKPPGMTPELFALVIVSTEKEREFSGIFSTDGKEYYFFHFPEGSGMMAAKRTNGRWSDPRSTPFISKYIDNEPQNMPDGKTMLFCNRGDIWW